jgi:predicted MPP superfamily phosphohydrolase
LPKQDSPEYGELSFTSLAFILTRIAYHDFTIWLVLLYFNFFFIFILFLPIPLAGHKLRLVFVFCIWLFFFCFFFVGWTVVWRPTDKASNPNSHIVGFGSFIIQRRSFVLFYYKAKPKAHAVKYEVAKTWSETPTFLYQGRANAQPRAQIANAQAGATPAS